MANIAFQKLRFALALTLVILLSSVPALAGLSIVGSNGIAASGADGINFWNTSGIMASGADNVLAFQPNGIMASGADGIMASGADGIMASGADSTSMTRADSFTATGANGIMISGADGTTYQADSITVRNPSGIMASGADNVTATGANGIAASGADTRNVAHADGITATGANAMATINGADSITATSPTGSVFSVTPTALTITGVSGIAASGADGIMISGADSFVSTGVSALISALNGAGINSGIAGIDPELAVLLNNATDDSNIDAVIIYRSLPTDTDIADLQRIGVLGGTRYHVLPMIAVSTTKRNLIGVSHLPGVRSIYGNRTLQWNLEPAARNLTGAGRIRGTNDLTNANHGFPVSGKGVTVAVLDTGVDGTHADLAGRVVQNVKLADTQSLGAGFNYPVSSPSIPDTDQAYGHGTFVAGVIAGNGQQSSGKYAGVASGANILGLSAGDASLFFILSGFDYLLANAQAFNVRVVNCSFSANTVFDVNDPVNIATRMLTDAGVSVVFSAGNTGPGADSLNPYSVAPWVISVGATDNTGRLAGFSSRGEFGSPLFRPTLVAPGVKTVSLRPSSLASVTTASAGENDSTLSATELPYYTTGSGTSFSAPQVAGVIALMLEINPQLTPAQIRDILQRTATPLPPYYLHEVGAGMLNAQAAVLEAAFSTRHFGSWRGVAFQNQVALVNSAPQTFAGSVVPGGSSDTVFTMPSNTLRASVQIAWGGPASVSNLTLGVIDSRGTQQALADARMAPGLTGRRQRTILDIPSAGSWTARVSTLNSGVDNSSIGTGGNLATYNTPTAQQTYYGVVQLTSARYAAFNDAAGLDNLSGSEIQQNFRSLVMSPIGSRFRPEFAITRADLARALVVGGRVPQYLPAVSNYSDVRDRATMLFVESAQASPNGALFPSIAAGSSFQPDATADRLTAVVALVRAAGLRQQAESGSNALTFTDAASIPASLRGYVAVAVQNGLIKTNGTTFNPAGAFTRLDLSHAMARLATLATQ